MFTSRTQATSYPALPLNPFAASTCEILNRLYPAKFHPLENLPAPAARRHSSFSLQENWLLSSLFATLTKSAMVCLISSHSGTPSHPVRYRALHPLEKK